MLAIETIPTEPDSESTPSAQLTALIAIQTRTVARIAYTTGCRVTTCEPNATVLGLNSTNTTATPTDSTKSIRPFL